MFAFSYGLDVHSESKRGYVNGYRLFPGAVKIILLGLFSFYSILYAQQPTNNTTQPPNGAQPNTAQPNPPVNAQQQPKRDEQDQSVSTLKVNVDVVNLFFNVKDKRGALVPNLTRNDFQVFEDGK